MAGTQVEIEWTGDSFNIPGRGLVCTARVLSTSKRSEVSVLMGKTIENPDGVFCRIRGIEMAAIGDDRIAGCIGLLLEPLEKPF